MNKKNVCKKILAIFLFIISFFICGNARGENVDLPQLKNYSDFSWDTFYENNKDYWNTICKGECDKRFLKQQERFYRRLYTILKRYQRKGIYIDDRVITETIFFEVSPGEAASASDGTNKDNNDYKEHWSKGESPFIFDISIPDDANDAGIDYGSIIDTDENQEFDNFYENERDTLKTLINNAVSIEGNCYYIFGNPTTVKLANGTSRDVCMVDGKEDPNISIYQLGKLTRKCAVKISTKRHSYYEYFLTSLYDVNYRIKHSEIKTFILGLKYDPVDYKECADAADDEHDTRFSYYGNKFEVDYNKYWTFLANNAYFDNKAHLQSYFVPVFDKIKKEEKIKVDCMKKGQCSNSVEETKLYEKYEEDIIEARESIIYSIMGLLEGYLKDDYTDEELAVILNYGKYGENYIYMDELETSRKSYYWPIGSDETEERDGRIFADGEPASMEITSYSGKRYNKALKKYEEHQGIDIKGEDGKTNVISVYDGEVYSVVNNCTVGDYTCNDGYGNQIIISHANGDYTVFGHLSDVLVSVGESVLKGQLIGHVGATGATLEPVLHYEIRSGSPSSNNSEDVLDIQSPSNPRPTGVSGDFSIHQTSLTKEEFVSKMRGYCNSTSDSKFINAFCSRIEEVYDASVANNLNPEFTVVRAMSEGFSPGGSTNNFWGIGCTNTGGAKACASYSSFRAGVAGLANLGIVRNSNTVYDVMGKNYAYIGAYWYNPGSWAKGGCKYFPYIAKYMSDGRRSTVSNACNGNACSGADCLKTTDEDQSAYVQFQMEKMTSKRYNVFGL